MDDIAIFTKFEVGKEGTNIDDDYQNVEAAPDVLEASIVESSSRVALAESQAQIDTIGSTSANYMRCHLAVSKLLAP